MFRTNVLSNQQIAENAYILSLPRIVKFKAGQVIKLYVEGGQQPRLYSIASGINEDELKILYDIKPQGQVTPLIRNLQPGDEVEISEPLGHFTDNDVPSFWIANGTGIAPFYSMFKSGLGAGKTLIHGGRTRNSFYFQEEFLSFFGDKYIRCCTKEKGDDLFEGRVTQYLTQQKFLPTNQKYYLCGSAEMVVETRDVLISKNIPFSNIIAEIYF